jgi:drug/metabolite transporter (DMT)-like permease
LTVSESGAHCALPADARSKRLDADSIAYLALLVTATIWGTTAIGIKVALETYPPFILTTGRWLLSLAILLPAMRRLGIRPILDRRTAILGLFGILGFNTFFTFGLERTTAANGSLINGALPVVVALISYLLLNERLSPIRVFGITLSLIGVVITVLGATLDASVLGNVLVFGAVLSWAVYTIYNRERLRGENALGIIAGSAIFGTLLMIPLAGAEWLQETPPGPGLGLAAIIVYLSIGPAMLANYFWVFALERVPASQAAVFSNLTPIVGIVLAGVLLDEPITRFHVIGALLVICGVLLTTWRRRPPTGYAEGSTKSIATNPVSPATETSTQR